MERETADEDVPRRARTGVVGSLLVAYWLLDGLVIGIPLVLLAVWLNPLIVFIVAAAVLVPLNIFFCRWLDANWDSWFAGNANRVEPKLRKMRKSSLMKRPVAWIQSGSDVWFGLAAAIINAITTVSLARLAGGENLGERRVLVAAVSYGLVSTGVWVLAGVLIGDALRAA